MKYHQLAHRNATPSHIRSSSYEVFTGPARAAGVAAAGRSVPSLSRSGPLAASKRVVLRDLAPALDTLGSPIEYAD